MELGEMIKKLRKEKGITQEGLAEYLNISFQAVSKWENGIALPDIKLLVPIADYFDVTVDYLLEGDKSVENQEVREILKKSYRNGNKGKVVENIKMLRKALDKYPKNYDLMSNLAHNLFISPKDDADEVYKEVIQLSEKVYKESRNIQLRKNQVFILVVSYKFLDQIDKAKELAKQQSGMYSTEESLMTKILEGDEGQEYTQGYISRLIDHLSMLIQSLTYPKYSGKKYTNLERIEILNKAIDMYDVLLGSEDLLFYNIRVANIHSYISRLYSRENNIELMTEHMKKAFYHAYKYENMPQKDNKFKSLILSKITHNPEYTTKSAEETITEELLAELDKEEFIHHKQMILETVKEYL